MQYVMPGIFAQTVVFNSAFTGVGVADDLSKGIIDRLRSLPMYQPAVLIGRTLSDVARNIVTFAVMFGVAFAVGFRIEGTLAGAVGATELMFLFGYAFSWIQALIGLSVGSVEAANSAGFIWMFPLTFISSAFVDVEQHELVAQADRRAQPLHVLRQRQPGPVQRLRHRQRRWISIAWALGITSCSPSWPAGSSPSHVDERSVRSNRPL